MILLGLMFAHAAGQISTPATPRPAPATKQALICKTRQETGSLLKRRKTCMTRTQWSRAAEENGRAAQQLTQDAAGRPADQ
ncbi:hypothetical protein [Sphingomonas carotinifaciens]|uniref:hypothetical protein n=1 Tax=Sphingomonas carotinifaciens TaxID=1166323 RepID=UPI000DD51640|nr:hypothetical protein [Sphingomonas carotinifaciens]